MSVQNAVKQASAKPAMTQAEADQCRAAGQQAFSAAGLPADHPIIGALAELIQQFGPVAVQVLMTWLTGYLPKPPAPPTPAS